MHISWLCYTMHCHKQDIMSPLYFCLETTSQSLRSISIATLRKLLQLASSLIVRRSVVPVCDQQANTGKDS